MIRLRALLCLLLTGCNAISGIDDYRAGESEPPSLDGGSETSEVAAETGMETDGQSEETVSPPDTIADALDGPSDIAPDAPEADAVPEADACAMHSNGIGQSYVHCAPLGTPGVASSYTLTMAEKARDAWALKPSTGDYLLDAGQCAGTCVQRNTADSTAIWCFTGAVAGHVRASALPPKCPTTGDATWN